MVESVVKFTDTLQDIKTHKPDFILDTGDLVESNNLDFFNAYAEILKSIDIPVYNTPGNHDRRDRYGQGDNLTNYYDIVKPLNGSVDAVLLDDFGDYYFDWKGYCFVGLDSGADYSVYTEWRDINPTMLLYLLLLGTPESNGLWCSQVERLYTLDPNIPKIIFMHHPVITDNHVYLLLTGHTHKDYVAVHAPPVAVPAITESYMFIQTRSATKDEHGYKHGYRVINITDGVISNISSETTPTLNRSTFTLSLANFVAEPESIWGISVRDSLGRHTGMNWTTGDIEREIPGSYYTGHYNKPPSDTPQVLVVYPSDNSLEVVYHALEYGDGTTLVTKESDVLVLTSSYNEVTGTETATVIAKRGSNGEHIWTESVSGTVPNLIVSAGDLGEDEKGDVLVMMTTSELDMTTFTTNTAARLMAKRGRDGEHLWEESVTGMDLSALSASDLNGDKKRDVVVHIHEYDEATDTTKDTVIAKRGYDGKRIWTTESDGPIWVGSAWADLNGDEIADVLLGSHDRVYALGYREE